MDRETQEFFYVDDDGDVRKVTGYICKNAPGYWWCPAVGFSACEGFNLYRDRAIAYEVAFRRAKAKLDGARAILERIEEERFFKPSQAMGRE